MNSIVRRVIWNRIIWRASLFTQTGTEWDRTYVAYMKYGLFKIQLLIWCYENKVHNLRCEKSKHTGVIDSKTKPRQVVKNRDASISLIELQWNEITALLKKICKKPLGCKKKDTRIACRLNFQFTNVNILFHLNEYCIANFQYYQRASLLFDSIKIYRYY